MNRISKRYARALLQIAAENNELDLYLEQFEECVQIIESSDTIYDILTNPENNRLAKIKLLDGLFRQSVNINILNLLKLIIDHQRLDLLSDILADYKKGMQEYTGTINVLAISAFPLTQNDIDPITTKLKHKYHAAHINLTSEIDESLIGGFKLIIGNEVIDRSVSGMMETMKNQVISG